MTKQWGLDCPRGKTSARVASTINRVLGALAIVCSGCTADEGASTDEQTVAVEVDEPREATKPTGSQDCNLSGSEALRLSLQHEGEFLKFLRPTDAIPVRIVKDVERGGTLTLEAVISSIDSPDARIASNHAIASSDTQIDVALPISALNLPAHSLAVSRRIRIHARLTPADGGGYEAATAVHLYFHPEAGGWRVYDGAVRSRDYSGGALTEAERAKRAAAFESLPPGVTAEYVSTRVTKLSDDPEYIPPDDATTSEETP